MTDALLTLDEVAARLHKKRRWLQNFLRDNPDCYRQIGRTRQFEPVHVARLIERIDQSCRSNFNRPVQVKPPSGTSEALSAADLSMRLQSRETKKLLKDLRNSLRSN